MQEESHVDRMLVNGLQFFNSSQELPRNVSHNLFGYSNLRLKVNGRSQTRPANQEIPRKTASDAAWERPHLRLATATPPFSIAYSVAPFRMGGRKRVRQSRRGCMDQG